MNIKNETDTVPTTEVSQEIAGNTIADDVYKDLHYNAENYDVIKNALNLSKADAKTIYDACIRINDVSKIRDCLINNFNIEEPKAEKLGSAIETLREPDTPHPLKCTFKALHPDISFIVKYDDIHNITYEYKGKATSFAYKSGNKKQLYISKEIKKEMIADAVTYFEVDKEEATNIVTDFVKKVHVTYVDNVNALKTNYEKQQEQPEAEEPVELEAWQTPEIHDKAIDILKNGDPCKFVMDTGATMHSGDEDAMRGLFLARMNQSILNSNGIQPAFNGASGKGKSHILETFIRMLPAMYVVNGSFSDKSLFYIELREGMFIINDDTQHSSGLETTLKKAMSNFQQDTIHNTVDGDRNGKKLTIPKRAVIINASVDSQGSDEFQNRQMSFTIDESREQDEKVHKMQNMKKKTGYDPSLQDTEEVLVCQAMFNIWAENLISVVIPFVDKIVWTNKENRRNYDFFLDMIGGFTMCNFMQREMNDEGFYEATIEDYKCAEALYNKISQTMGSKLTKAEIKMANKLAKLFQHTGCTVNEMQAVVNISQNKVRDRLKILEEKIPQMYSQEETESISSSNENGIRISNSTRYKKYYLPAFSVANYNKAVYLNMDD